MATRLHLRFKAKLLICASVLFLCPTPTFSCRCVWPPPPIEAAKKADLVFLGTVTEIREVFHPGDPWLVMYVKKWLGWYRHIRRPRTDLACRTEVASYLKGYAGPSIAVLTNKFAAGCGYPFQSGEEYLVYAYVTQDGDIRTGLCTRTRPADAAAEEIGQLQEAWRELTEK
jgi:hypothetical protein